MKSLKVQLHVHTGEDPIERPRHTAIEMLDFAAANGYDVVAITLHNIFLFTSELKAYADKLGILLVPGIEKNIGRRHVLIINATQEAEKLVTFYDLCKYKKSHPECLVIAPHPYYPRGFCLQDKLLENINLFDAIEYSWFYTERWNAFNKKAEKVAKLHRKAIIATSDNHILPYFDHSYTLVQAEKNWISIREAILANKIEMVTKPLRLKEFFKLTLRMITEFDVPYQYRSLRSFFQRARRDKVS